MKMNDRLEKQKDEEEPNEKKRNKWVEIILAYRKTYVVHFFALLFFLLFCFLCVQSFGFVLFNVLSIVTHEPKKKASHFKRFSEKFLRMWKETDEDEAKKKMERKKREAFEWMIEWAAKKRLRLTIADALHRNDLLQ